jgi:hypothetical protein
MRASKKFSGYILGHERDVSELDPVTYIGLLWPLPRNSIVTADNTSRLNIASATETSNRTYIIVIINHSEHGMQ